MLAATMSSTMALYAATAVAAIYFISGWRAWHAGALAPLWLPALGIAAHFALLLTQLFRPQGVAIGIWEALSLFTWQSAALLLLFCLREPLRILGALVYPLAGVAA